MKCSRAQSSELYLTYTHSLGKTHAEPWCSLPNMHEGLRKLSPAPLLLWTLDLMAVCLLKNSTQLSICISNPTCPKHNSTPLHPIPQTIPVFPASVRWCHHSPSCSGQEFNDLSYSFLSPHIQSSSKSCWFSLQDLFQI